MRAVRGSEGAMFETLGYAERSWKGIKHSCQQGNVQVHTAATASCKSCEAVLFQARGGGLAHVKVRRRKAVRKHAWTCRQGRAGCIVNSEAWTGPAAACPFGSKLQRTCDAAAAAALRRPDACESSPTLSPSCMLAMSMASAEMAWSMSCQMPWKRVGGRIGSCSAPRPWPCCSIAARAACEPPARGASARAPPAAARSAPVSGDRGGVHGARARYVETHCVCKAGPHMCVQQFATMWNAGCS
eukprot:425937-Pleurochrysis_carterae.AAC.2